MEDTNILVESTQSVVEQLADVLETKAEESTVLEQKETVQEENKDIDNNKALKGRLNDYERKGYKRGYTEAEQKLRADYEQELTELRQYKQEREIDRLAQELADTEQISLELAKRIIRAEQSLPKAKQETAPTEPQADVYAQREAELLKQEDFVQRAYGISALELFNNADDTTKAKIARGEMDFIDLAKESLETKKVPKTVKNSHFGKLETIDFKSMSKKQIAELDEKIKNGGRLSF